MFFKFLLNHRNYDNNARIIVVREDNYDNSSRINVPTWPSRDSYCDLDHNKRFFFFFTLMETLASEQQSLVRASSVLVILYHAGTFHASKRRKMTNDENLYFEKYWWPIQRAWKFYTHSLFKIHIWSYLRFDSIPLFRSGYDHVDSMYATGVFDPRETPVE